MNRSIEVESVVLSAGAHVGPEDGMCLMEMVSYMAGEPWSDQPKCVSLVLSAFLRSWNDDLDDATRQKLKPYAARVIGTADDGKDQARAWMAVDWLARTQLPVWLDLAGLSEHAVVMRALGTLSDPVSADAAQPALNAARGAALDAGRAAGVDVVWDAAVDAAWDAARDAAVNAAWDAARAAAWDAARATAGAAAWVAAGAASLFNATVDAARDAAGAASRDLKPTVAAMQVSAFDLLDRMVSL